MSRKVKAETPPDEALKNSEPAAAAPVVALGAAVLFSEKTPVPFEPAPAAPTPAHEEPAFDELPNLGNIASLRGEIMAKLPTLRNIAHSQPIVFFCEEVVRALNGLESNMESYCEKIRMEARQRAAASQEKKAVG